MPPTRISNSSPKYLPLVATGTPPPLPELEHVSSINDYPTYTRSVIVTTTIHAEVGGTDQFGQ